jgi:hypothetical protein
MFNFGDLTQATWLLDGVPTVSLWTQVGVPTPATAPLLQALFDMLGCASSGALFHDAFTLSSVCIKESAFTLAEIEALGGVTWPGVFRNPMDVVAGLVRFWPLDDAASPSRELIVSDSATWAGAGISVVAGLPGVELVPP